MSAEHGIQEALEPQASQAAGDEQFGGSGGFELDEDGQRIPHGMGQSKSSRRRRRKRKNKVGESPAAAGGVIVMPGESIGGGGESASAQSIPALQGSGDAPQQSFRQNGNQSRSFQNGGGQPQTGGPNNAQNGGPNATGTKRWKKKFRDRDRQRGGTDNPGNQQTASGQGFVSPGGQFNAPYGGSNGGGFRGPDTHQPGNGGGFKRKGGFGGQGGGKQRSAPRGFVGPMDHSYRAANGNVFETPPATIDPYGNSSGYNGGGRSRSYSGSSDSQPIDYSMGRPIPISPDAPTKIYFFIEDLFFIAKIQETARKLGVKVAFIKNEKEQIAALTDAAEEDRPGLIVFDLNNSNAKPMTLIPKLKTKLKKTTSIIGFLSHLQGDLKAKAVEAGCDTVMPRAAFSQNLPNLLRRYGIEEVEELNYNQ